MEAAHQAEGYVEESVEPHTGLRMVGHEQACLPKEEAMDTPNPTLPVALRSKEITEQERDSLFNVAADPNATTGVLDWTPRRVARRSRKAVNS